MKIATWKDGTKTVRKTHTRDYTHAWKYTDELGEVITGFSTSLKNAQTASNSATKRGFSKPRTFSPYYENYVRSGKKAIDDARTAELRKTIEIVEVETK